MDPHDAWLAGLSRRASPWKRADSKADHPLLQPNGLRTESTGMGFGTYPTDFPLNKPFLRAKSGRRIPSRAATSLPLQDLL